jgi:diguanylate cyclase (GGDEF)-like protein
MDEITINRILEQCTAIDADAALLYELLAGNTESDELKQLWQKITQDFQNHGIYWQKLMDWANKGILPQIFEDPQTTFKELDSIKIKVANLLRKSVSISKAQTAFLAAFKIEFYLLHPAFETLFQYIKTITDESSPGDDYDTHINTLFESLPQYGLETLELELLGETIHRLWKENKKMAVQNNHDVLTGILNRRGLFNAIKPLSHLAQRNNNNIGLMMIDIDRFKLINDKYGHQFGDEVLRFISKEIKACLRASDILGRYGGEEFLVFLSSVDPDALKDVGEKVRRSVEMLNKDYGNVTISIGLHQGQMGDDIEKDLDLFIKKADEKLYQAKNAGRNRIAM